MQMGDIQSMLLENIAADEPVSWFSKDETIATVDQQGTVTAVSGEDRLVMTCMGTIAAKSMSSSIFCKGEELGFTVTRFAPERIVRTIIIFPAM